MTVEEQVILVDKNDNQTGIAGKMAAHEQALLHRAFSVFVYRKAPQGAEILLQHRQLDKYHCGGLWTNTCCSHPRPDESILDAGSRRLQEEMGFSLALLKIGEFIYKAVFANGLTEHELDHVLVGEFGGESIEINPLEVAAFRWVSLSELEVDLNTNPHQYTPWLAPALELFVKWLNIQTRAD